MCGVCVCVCVCSYSWFGGGGSEFIGLVGLFAWALVNGLG